MFNKILDNIYNSLFVIVFVIFIFIEPIVDFILLGGIIFYFGMKAIFLIRRLKKQGIEQQGRYVRFNSDRKGYKTPVISFETRAGNTIEEEPFFYSSTDLSKIRNYQSKIGTQVTVIYDPKNPKKFVIKSEEYYNYFGLFITMFAASVFIVVAILHFMKIINLDGS